MLHTLEDRFDRLRMISIAMLAMIWFLDRLALVRCFQIAGGQYFSNLTPKTHRRVVSGSCSIQLLL